MKREHAGGIFRAAPATCNSEILIGRTRSGLREGAPWRDKLRLYLAQDSLHPFFCAGRTIAETGGFRLEFLDPPFSCAQFVCEIVAKSSGAFVFFAGDAGRLLQCGHQRMSGLVDRYHVTCCRLDNPQWAAFARDR
jgi:hypothetical protein